MNNDVVFGIPAWIFWGLLIFFALREVNAWYWKVNQIVDKLDSIDKSLKSINSKLGDEENNNYSDPEDSNIISDEVTPTENVVGETLDTDIKDDTRSTLQKIKDIMNKDLF